MSPAEIEELRRLHIAASPVPWVIQDGQIVGRPGVAQEKNERLVVAARNALPALLDELAAADQEIARLQDVAAASQRLFGVKVARVEIAFDDELTVSDIVVIATCPGGDEPQIARLVGQRLEKELQSIADARREKRLEKLDELDGSKPGEDEDLHVLEVELLQEQLQTRYFSGPDRRRIARLLREVLRRRANASGKES